MQRLPPCWWSLAERVAQAAHPFVLGINGAQGSGKTTLATALQRILAQEYGLQVAVLSMDDVYHTRAHRRWLSEHIHPLLLTRGVPGTHDVALGIELVRRFRAGRHLQLPRFDKASDDRKLESDWLQGPADILILEGWCLGTTAQSEAQLQEPVNELEAQQDENSVWRGYVNDCLSGEYQRWFSQLDELIMLQAPDWETVIDWRLEQEQALIAGSGKGMNRAELKDFMLHYQRLTQYQLESPPERVDWLYELDKTRQVIAVQERKK